MSTCDTLNRSGPHRPSNCISKVRELTLGKLAQCREHLGAPGSKLLRKAWRANSCCLHEISLEKQVQGKGTLEWRRQTGSKLLEVTCPSFR